MRRFKEAMITLLLFVLCLALLVGSIVLFEWLNFGCVDLR